MQKIFRFNVHSHYSRLKNSLSIPEIVENAIADGLAGVALTDDGVMYGIKEFVDYCSKVNAERIGKGLDLFKPIIGCDMYVAPRTIHDKAKEDAKCSRLIVLAKNLNGYRNIIKLVSISWIQGLFMNVPRTDRFELEKYKEGIIAIYSGEDKYLVQLYKSIFGNDFYPGTAIQFGDEILENVDIYNIDNEQLLPSVKIPENYSSVADYLKCLVYEGAIEKYGNPVPFEVHERIEYELSIINEINYSGYFLFWAEIVNCACKEMNVWIGPGRGSSAACIVNYCLKITKIDPMKYGLPFERFLRPGGMFFPDIDIDIDPDGRERVLEWIQNKYGNDNVAHLIAFIKDHEGKFSFANVHACGLIVSPHPIINIVPLCTKVNPFSPKKKIILTQYDGTFIESTGLIKFDILGLRVFSEMKECLCLVKQNRGIEISVDNIPLDDEKTFALYQEGNTLGTFQFDSQEMQKILHDLQPLKFDDLVAMYAMSRPTMINKITLFIARKNGTEEIKYDHPSLEQYLKDTYGIIIYQEQIMDIVKEVAGFSFAVGYDLCKSLKEHEIVEGFKLKFFEGGLLNGYNSLCLEAIWKSIELLGPSAFNKSHAVAYTWIAYQSAYLKVHYPEEYIASILKLRSNEGEEIQALKEGLGVNTKSHPIERYREKINRYCNAECNVLENLEDIEDNKYLSIAGLVTNIRIGVLKSGGKYGIIKIEDGTNSSEIPFFGQEWKRNKDALEVNKIVIITGYIKEGYGKKRFENITVYDIETPNELIVPN